MILTLTHDQMLDLWRNAAGLEPVEAEASIERFDAIDLTRRLELAMRQWYLHLIDKGDPALLVAENIADRLKWHSNADRRLHTAAIPRDIRRITTIRADETSLPLSITDNSDLLRDEPVARRSFISPLSYDASATPTGRCSRLSAVFVGGGVIAIRADRPPLIVTGVTDPGEERYILDEAALAMIPHDINLYYP